GDPEIEVVEHRLQRGDVQSVVHKRLVDTVDEARGARPIDPNVPNLHPARFRQPLTQIVPVAGENDARLIGRHDREDVGVCTLEDTFEYGQVGDSTARGE